MGFVAQRDLENQIEMTFLSPSLQNFSHWFLLLGSESDSIEPDILKIMVLEKLDNIKNRVNGNPHFNLKKLKFKNFLEKEVEPKSF